MDVWAVFRWLAAIAIIGLLLVAAITYSTGIVTTLQTVATSASDLIAAGRDSQPAIGEDAYTAKSLFAALAPAWSWSGGPTWDPWAVVVGLLRAVATAAIAWLIFLAVVRISRA